MTGQQKTHSELAPNVKEKIHHLCQPSSRPAEPDQSSQPLWQQIVAFRSGGEEKSIMSRGGLDTFPTRQLNDMSVVKNISVIPYLHPGHYSSSLKILIFFRSVFLPFIFSFLLRMSYRQSITNMCHKSGVKHSSCLQATSPGLIYYGV